MHRRPCVGLATLAVALLGTAGCGGSSTSKPGADASATSTSAAATNATSSTRPEISSPTATASSGTALEVTASAGGVSATLHGSTHEPRVERAWPLHLTVTRGGRPVKASVSYEYLFGGQVVAHRDRYTFVGHFSDIFKWPPAAVGYPLTFRAVVVSEGATVNLEYPVRVGT
jgi:hypothetical protein